MRFVNKDNVYMTICFDVFGDVSSRATATIQHSSPRRERLTTADFLEFTAGSEVSVVQPQIIKSWDSMENANKKRK